MVGSQKFRTQNHANFVDLKCVVIGYAVVQYAILLHNA
jgi:hypothetical protein